MQWILYFFLSIKNSKSKQKFHQLWFCCCSCFPICYFCILVVVPYFPHWLQPLYALLLFVVWFVWFSGNCQRGFACINNFLFFVNFACFVKNIKKLSKVSFVYSVFFWLAAYNLCIFLYFVSFCHVLQKRAIVLMGF